MVVGVSDQEDVVIGKNALGGTETVFRSSCGCSPNTKEGDKGVFLTTKSKTADFVVYNNTIIARVSHEYVFRCCPNPAGGRNSALIFRACTRGEAALSQNAICQPFRYRIASMKPHFSK